MHRPLLCILGFGGHARSVADIALAAGIDDLVFVDANARPGENFAGFPALSSFEQLPAGRTLAYFPALGDNVLRQQLVGDASLPFTTLISPTASIGRLSVVHVASLVAHHAHVGPSASIGRGAIINTGAIVEHESIVGDFSHVAVNATVGGRSRLGRRVLVAAGAVVINGMSVCDDVLIGAGATVVADITESGTYVGSPARRVR